jgi:hypothetical protein
MYLIIKNKKYFKKSLKKLKYIFFNFQKKNFIYLYSLKLNYLNILLYLIGFFFIFNLSQ